MGFDHRRFVARLVSDREFERIAEIGVFKAELSELLWSIPTVEHILLVDPYDAYCAEIERDGKLYRMKDHRLWTQERFDELYQELIYRMPDKATHLRMRSVEAARQVADRSLDFVFIDAVHLYEEVTEDIEAWRPKIRPGGIISGDDYTNKFEGLKRAVSELLPHHQSEGRVWWAQV